MSYAVDGRQYVAVSAGNVVYSFALPGNEARRVFVAVFALVAFHGTPAAAQVLGPPHAGRRAARGRGASDRGLDRAVGRQMTREMKVNGPQSSFGSR